MVTEHSVNMCTCCPTVHPGCELIAPALLQFICGPCTVFICSDQLRNVSVSMEHMGDAHTCLQVNSLLESDPPPCKNTNHCLLFANWWSALLGGKKKRKGEKKDDVGKGKAKQHQGKEPVKATEIIPDSTRQEASDDQRVDLARISLYKTCLHKKASQSVVCPYIQVLV